MEKQRYELEVWGTYVPDTNPLIVDLTDEELEELRTRLEALKQLGNIELYEITVIDTVKVWTLGEVLTEEWASLT